MKNSREYKTPHKSKGLEQVFDTMPLLEYGSFVSDPDLDATVQAEKFMNHI